MLYNTRRLAAVADGDIVSGQAELAVQETGELLAEPAVARGLIDAEQLAALGRVRQDGLQLEHRFNHRQAGGLPPPMKNHVVLQGRC